MISRRTMFRMIAGGSCAAATVAQAPLARSDGYDQSRPSHGGYEGSGVCTVKWFNRRCSFGVVRSHDDGYELIVKETLMKASGIDVSMMRPGRSFIAHWALVAGERVPIRLQPM